MLEFPYLVEGKNLDIEQKFGLLFRSIESSFAEEKKSSLSGVLCHNIVGCQFGSSVKLIRFNKSVSYLFSPSND